jgi:hypothetical protein
MAGYTTKAIDDCISEARAMVNDAVAPFRNPDALLVAYLNSALLTTFSIRPDAFIGNFQQGILSFPGVIQFATSDLQTIDGTANPMPPATPVAFPCDQTMFYNPVVVYIAARIEIADDEYTETSRSAQLMQSFIQQLRGM